MRGLDVLITGATGTFGHAFVPCALSAGARRVIVYSRDEAKQSEMCKLFPDPRIRYFIGDVRDQDRLRRALHGVDYVIHAAAMKQVPACEYNPIEAGKTNIFGAQNVIEASLDSGVKKVVAISTDKAVNPVNAYGASKLFAEKLFVAANAYSGKDGARFSCVRYGNVSGSRGSVIPAWRKMAKAGDPLPVTDSRMSRFWMIPSEAVSLVAMALDTMVGGEVFIPKLPSYWVKDLAEAVALEQGSTQKAIVTGVRPGEKMHEALIGPDESRMVREMAGRYLVMPSYDWTPKEAPFGVEVEDGFTYTSLNNSSWLNTTDLVEELRKVQ